MSQIKTIDDLLKNPEILNRVLGNIRLAIDDIENIKPNKKYTISIKEQNNGLYIDRDLVIFEELKLLRVDWRNFKKQGIKQLRNRKIECSFRGRDILNLYERSTGKKSVIKPRTLNAIAKLIADLDNKNSIVEFLIDCGVSKKLLLPLSESQSTRNMIFQVLLILSSTSSKKDKKTLLKIFEGAISPLLHKGDNNKAEEYKNRFNTLLKLEGYLVGDTVKDSNKFKIKFSDGVLYFQEKKLDFNRKPKQKDLLNTLFKDLKKNWYYDEIQEDWDPVLDIDEYRKDDKKWYMKFYSAGDEINQAIAIETGVKDFITKNTKRIRINEKYI